MGRKKKKKDKGLDSGFLSGDDGLDRFIPPKPENFPNAPRAGEIRVHRALLLRKCPITAYQLNKLKISLGTTHRVLRKLFNDGYGKFKETLCGKRRSKGFLLNQKGREFVTKRIDEYEFTQYEREKRSK